MMIFLAPLQGYTDYIFRNIYARHFSGIDIAVSPFISLVPGEFVARNRIRDVIPENNTSEIPLIPQILGNDPNQYITLINHLKPFGYDSFNWNCGCPVNQVARKGRGAGILQYPDTMDKVLSQVLSNTDVSISVKLRLGYKTPDEMFEVIDVLNHHPIEQVIIHPRIGIQGYEGSVNLDGLEQFLLRIKHKIVYNGDIFSVEDYHRIKSRFPNVENIMLGRGVLRNLTLPLQIKEGLKTSDRISPDQFVAFYEDFVSTQSSYRRPDHLSGVIKQYWIYFRYMLDADDQLMLSLLRATELDDILKIGNRIINEYEIQYK